MNKKTYKYFKDRERKHQEQKIKDDEKFSKVLEKEYQRALREIENRINWWIGKYADDNEIYIEQARQIVREADIKELKEKAKEYVKNKDLSPKANKEMRIYNLKMKVARDELLQKYIDLELAKLGTKEEKLLEDRIFNETEEELKRQAGILGDSLISKEKVKSVFEQIVNDSHVSAHFSNYIWANIKELRNDLQNGLNRSILRGQNPNVWKSDLYKHFKGNVKKAEFYAKRLAVTETAIAQTKAGLISAKENGYDKVIIITEPGACKHCKPHDGNIVDIDEAKMGDNVPIWHPFCRCTVAAYYEYEDENIIQSGGDGKIYPISDKTIDNLETPYIESLSKKENEHLNEYHKLLLKEARDKNESMEVAYKFNSFDGKIEKIYGDATELDMGHYSSKYVLHNHPNNSQFSNLDLLYFADSNTRYMTLVKHNGEIEVLEKLEGFSKKDFVIEYERAKTKYKHIIESNETLGYNKVVNRVISRKKVKIKKYGG